MDLHGARTAADIERKYNFGKSFAEVTGIATDARTIAENAAKLDENLTQDEIFKRLTNNGTAHGIFKDDKGDIYINAAYIVALSEMFANNITMTGTFTNTVDGYLPPGEEEINTLQAHILGAVTIPAELLPLYDFNSDGEYDSRDLLRAQRYRMGWQPFSEWDKAVKTPVTMTIDMTDPEKAIRFTGANMWGREVEGYVGVNFTSARCPETEERIKALEDRIAALEAGTS